jgi:ribosomal protein L12E/L44/L45/RPP1/RPP2
LVEIGNSWYSIDLSVRQDIGVEINNQRVAVLAKVCSAESLDKMNNTLIDNYYGADKCNIIEAPDSLSALHTQITDIHKKIYRGGRMSLNRYYKSITVKQLQEIAKASNIKYSKLRKQELIDKITMHKG